MDIEKNKRILSIDILRASAILLMIWAHVTAFVSKQGQNYFDSHWINIIRQESDKICFIIFLFLSGVALTVSILQKESKPYFSEVKFSIRKTYKKTLSLIFGYYIIALIVFFDKISNLKDIIYILTFSNVAPYTEFLIPFIFIGLIIPFLINPLKKILNLRLIFSLSIILFSSAFLYFLGTYLYKKEFYSCLLNYKALIAGHKDMIRFPILQYLGIYFLGTWTGKIIGAKKMRLKKAKIHRTWLQKIIQSNPSLNSYFLLITLTLLCLFIFFKINESAAAYPYQWAFHRWPPTISFLTQGLLWCFFPLSLLNGFNTNKLTTPFIFISKNSLNFFIIHIILLQIYKKILPETYSDSIPVIIVSFLGILILCSLIVWIWESTIGNHVSQNKQK